MKHIKLFESKREESNFSKILNKISLVMGDTIIKEFDKTGILYRLENWSLCENSIIWESGVIIDDLDYKENHDFGGEYDFPDRYSKEECGEWAISFRFNINQPTFNSYSEIDDVILLYEKLKNLCKSIKNKNLNIDSVTSGSHIVFEINYPISNYFEENNQIFKDINVN